MATIDYGEKLRKYAKNELHDSIEGLDWKQLLEWEHRHLQYMKGELPRPRAELPIDIILQTKGRCGEFVLLYNGLVLANKYKSRIVIDCSELKDNSRSAAGYHVWNEILVNKKWLHVDPTDRRIDQPGMYIREWNKDVNAVFAIEENEILDVTDKYARG
jgi:hypothetical protein